MTTLTFPEGFRWGVATAAAQIEGAAHEGGKADSIWDVFAREPGAILDSSNLDVTCDHYHRLGEDIALMKDLGVGTFRFSVSWARVMPDGRTVNEEGLDFYERLVDALRAAHVDPWLTLYHWDLPAALGEKGGWTKRETAFLFADYARAVYERLGSKVGVWTTLNEPWCSSLLSYAGGEHAPGHTDPGEAVAAAHHLLLAHGLGVKAIREAAAARGEKPTLGITLNFTVAHPADPNDPGDVDAARRIDGTSNRLFLDPILRGAYPDDVVADMAATEDGDERCDIRTWIRQGDLEIISTPIDVLGVNFYNGQMVRAADPLDRSPLVRSDEQGRPRRSPNVGSERVRGVSRGLPLTHMGWEVGPDDLCELLIRLEREYTGPAGIPLVITENGAAYDDAPDETGFVDDSGDRLAYIRGHLAAVHEAIAEGANVVGYLEWSLMDNFEWAFGFTKRFGIVRVDYDTQARTPKASALWYRDVMKNNAFDIE